MNGLPPDAVLTAAAVAAGRALASDVLATHLEHIAATEPDVRALVYVDRAAAQAQAADVDRRRREGAELGPLAGVPIVVKDNVDIAGQITHCGSAVPDEAATEDAEIVRRLRRADAILLGRANMDELAMGASTQTSTFGRTRNPYDPRRSAGGSSGGSAAAVAAFEVPLAIGTDTGGSIREPASQCGVVGLAPTPGSVPMTGIVPFAPDLDRAGPMARTVTDTALLLDVLRGRPAAADPLGGGSRPLVGLRIGVVDELSGERNQPGVLARLQLVLDTCIELGAEVQRVSVPDASGALASYMVVSSLAAARLLAPYMESDRVGEEVRRRYDQAYELLHHHPDLITAAERLRDDLAAQVVAALDTSDVLLSPTMPTTAPPLEGGDDSDSDIDNPMATPYTDCWTVVANLTGIPALSLPSGLSDSDRMPVATMLAGRPGADDLLLAVGARLERAGVNAGAAPPLSVLSRSQS